MTHAANVISGYVLAAVAVLAYAAWVVRRGRSLGRGLGIAGTGATGDRGEPGSGDHAGEDASAERSAPEHGKDTASAAP
jgi:hypothetical protein